MKIGIIGAGAIGGAIAKLAVDQGHQVMISSRHPDTLVALAERIGCNLGTVDAAAQFGELIVVAIPLKELARLPAQALAGKIVVDTMNYYPERDGVIEVLDARATTTSALVAAHLSGARVVKAFNAILARDLPSDARPPVASGRRALPISGDDAASKQIVAGLHREIRELCANITAGALSVSAPARPSTRMAVVKCKNTRQVERIYFR
jgi:predicted dinucleotide-binding enzyme